MSTAPSIARRYPARGRLTAALVLQCPPLLAAISFFVGGFYGEAAQQIWFRDLRWLVVLSACCWGLGYLPLRRWGRAAGAFAAGVGGNLLAANAALGAWSVAPDGAGEAALGRAALAWASGIAVAVVALLIDTWHLGHGPRTGGSVPAQRMAEPKSSNG